VGLASNNLNLDSAQPLLALLESQPNLLRRQVGDRASNRADVVGDWRIAVGRQLNPDRPFHRGSPPMPKGRLYYPERPHLRSTPSIKGCRHFLMAFGLYGGGVFLQIGTAAGGLSSLEATFE
jgi:hypothetical protein